MAYGVTILKEQAASQVSGISAGSLDTASNATSTAGAGSVLTGQIKPIATAISAGALDLATNVVLS